MLSETRSMATLLELIAKELSAAVPLRSATLTLMVSYSWTPKSRSLSEKFSASGKPESHIRQSLMN